MTGHIMPIRIQRKRTKGWRMPPNAVNVCRPTEFGNPYRVYMVRNADRPWFVDDSLRVWTFSSRREALNASVALFRSYIYHPINSRLRDRCRVALRRRDLACWCPLEDEHGNHVPCHADVLLEIANGRWADSTMEMTDE